MDQYYTQMSKSVQSVQTVCKWITSVCFFANNRKMTILRLHDEQTVNGLRKITWASVFCLPFEMATYLQVQILYIYIYIYAAVSIYIFEKQTAEVCFLGRQTINGYRQFAVSSNVPIYSTYCICWQYFSDTVNVYCTYEHWAPSINFFTIFKIR